MGAHANLNVSLDSGSFMMTHCIHKICGVFLFFLWTHIGYRFCSGFFICIFIYGDTLDTDYAAFYVFVVLFVFSFTTDYAAVFFCILLVMVTQWIHIM